MTNAAYDKIMLTEIKNEFSSGYRKATIEWKESEVNKNSGRETPNQRSNIKNFLPKIKELA